MGSSNKLTEKESWQFYRGLFWILDDTNSEPSLPDRIKASPRPPEKMRPILDKVWNNPTACLEMSWFWLEEKH